MAAGLIQRIASLTRQKEARGFIVSFAPTLLALVLQLAAFVLLGRALGAAQFGQISAALALAVVLVEVVGLGSGDILVRAVVREPEAYPRYFDSALRLGLLTLPVAAALGWGVARYGLGLSLSPWPLAALMGAEIAAARIAATAESVAVAHRHIVRASAVRLGPAVARFILALVVLDGLQVKDVNVWIWWTTGQSLLTSGVFLVVIIRAYGAPRGGFAPASEVGTGVLFAVNQTARATQGNFDRAFMAAVADGATIGAYAAGSRFVQLGLFPVQILNRMLYPRFFAAGHEGGLGATRRYAVKVAPAALAVGALGASAVACVALLAPTLLGKSFASTTPITLVLCCALPLMALQYPAADALTGAGKQALRTVLFTATALVFSLGLAAGAAAGGLWGVAVAFVLGHAVLALLLWGFLFGLPAGAAPPGAAVLEAAELGEAVVEAAQAQEAAVS